MNEAKIKSITHRLTIRLCLYSGPNDYTISPCTAFLADLAQT
jgi:hypothetical protein